MERTVLARKENTMIGWRWTGNEPDELNDLELAKQFGAVWEGDELVHYDMEGLCWQLAEYEHGDYMYDND
jgi:hypothetical protein